MHLTPRILDEDALFYSPLDDHLNPPLPDAGRNFKPLRAWPYYDGGRPVRDYTDPKDRELELLDAVETIQQNVKDLAATQRAQHEMYVQHM